MRAPAGPPGARTCWASQSGYLHLEKAQELCDDKEECTLVASRKIFSLLDECLESEDSNVLYVTYRCNGGKDMTMQHGPKKHSNFYPQNIEFVKKTNKISKELNLFGKCWPNKGWKLKRMNIVGSGGGINMRCLGGCLKIHQILYSCEETKPWNPEQLKKAQKLCDEKEECTVMATRKMFGNQECPDSPEKEMNLKLQYSCEGGKDRTRFMRGINYLKPGFGETNVFTKFGL